MRAKSEIHAEGSGWVHALVIGFDSPQELARFIDELSQIPSESRELTEEVRRYLIKVEDQGRTSLKDKGR